MLEKLKILPILLVLLVSGCIKSNHQEVNFIFDIVNELSSETYNGRLTGTEGNNLAVSYIVNKFLEIGLEPLSNNRFTLEYDHVLFDPNSIQFTVEIMEGDSLKKALVRGKDFLERSGFTDYEGIYFLTTDRNDSDLQNKYVLLENGDYIHQVYEKAQGILVLSSLDRTLSVDTLKKPIIQVNKETYNYLEGMVDQEVKIRSKSEKVVIQAENVVGKIKGSNKYC